ncbi:MAG: DUF4346 domain-containing protein [Promethearchaeota archaeon]
MGKKKKILWMITGGIAEQSIKSILSNFSNIRIIKGPVSVASFLTKGHISKLLDDHTDIREGIVILPGSVRWDVESLSCELKVPIIKGPRNLNDLPAFVKQINNILVEKPEIPFIELIKELKRIQDRKKVQHEKYRRIIEERIKILNSILNNGRYPSKPEFAENSRILSNLSNPHRNFSLENGRLLVGIDFPPIIMAEIINAAEKNEEEIEKKTRYFLKSGAEIIDVGSTPGKVEAKKLGEIIQLIKSKFKCPVSIDSLDEKEILAGVNGGASIILSIDQGNKEIIDSLNKDVALVLIPTDMKKGVLSNDPSRRAKILLDLVKYTRERGFNKLLVDPILNSPIISGIMNSLEAFSLFRKYTRDDPEIEAPFFIGGSNVTEMIDTDSTGVNAFFAVLGVELGAGILFTTEDSMKCLGSIHELRMARDLAFQAKIFNTHPKDLSINAFNCKSKKRAVTPIKMENIKDLKSHFINDSFSTKYVPDPSGKYVKIIVDHESGLIYLAIYLGSKLLDLFKGTSAERIGKAVVASYPELSKDHVLYIGRELARAEHALKHYAVFIQDE